MATDTLTAEAEIDARADAAKAALAAEWEAAAPTTPAEIAHFYRTSQCQAADQAAWHAQSGRRTAMLALCQVAEQSGAQRIVDIGCGSGYDLAALRELLPAAHLAGVEPNIYQQRAAAAVVERCEMHGDISDAPLEDADLLICIDVLEHLPEPEAMLSEIASRARLGAFLYESTATHDLHTPLHLRSNIGWHPGQCLDRHGWQLCSLGGGRNRVWRRERVAAPPRVAILLCAYRAVSVPTVNALLYLASQACPGADGQPYRILTKYGDGLIARSRSILMSRWYAECADDVAVFIDDDVTFTPEDIQCVVERCRETRSIVCGAYPVGDGTHFACRAWDGTGEIQFGAEAALLEVQYAATGFMAVHRDVLDAMMPTLPWCHPSEDWAFKTIFDTATVDLNGDPIFISEDWQFCHRARELGFKSYLDPRVRIGHLKETELHVRNMALLAEAVKINKY